jgi:methionyl-tRNA formyltransferase
MRLLMMGTGPFAVPTFASLLDSTHQVVALVARPVPPPKGRIASPPAPMRDLALARGVPILEPDDINAPASRQALAALDFQLLVACDYGQILSADTLAVSPLGGINLHASLLPKYRGAAPINWAIYQGDAETGVTVLHMTARLDSGPCLVQRRTPIGPDEDAVVLEKRLSEIGVDAVREALDMIARWDGQSLLGEVQDPLLATKAPRLKKTDGEISWNRTAAQIANQVRALKPWPGTFTTWPRAGGEAMRLILDRVSIVSAAQANAPPGQVVLVDKSRLLVATGDGLLSLDRIKPAGKRSMDIGEFLRGHPMEIGDRLTAE